LKFMNRQVEHPYLDTLALLLVVVVLGGSVFGYTRFLASEEAKEQQATRLQQRRQLIDKFDKFMRLRDQFMALSLSADTTLGAIGDKVLTNVAAVQAWDQQYQAGQATFQDQVAGVRAHNAAEDAKYKADPRYTTRNYWPMPTPPDPPAPLSVDFTAETATLKVRAGEIKAYQDTLRAAQSDFSQVELKTLYQDLLRATGDMYSEVTRDIDILGSVVIDAPEGRIVNVVKTDLLKYNAQDPGVKAGNAQAVAFIKAQGLRLKDYDVPGGSDLNPNDMSRLL
jgi:hypothetical protein